MLRPILRQHFCLHIELKTIQMTNERIGKNLKIVQTMSNIHGNFINRRFQFASIEICEFYGERIPKDL